MNLREARKIVIHAGKQLLESGLIARTWGNVSCRISETQFVITPSGRAYETLTPDEIVLVNIEDCNYVGDLKPSSEKGIHAEVYKRRHDVNFVIHTHQANASMVSPLQIGIDVTDPEMAAIIGPRVPTAAYGLPGTKKLAKGVAEALMPNSQAVIMAYHGALCMGQDYEEAFRVASTLEKACADFVKERYLVLSGDEVFDETALREQFVVSATNNTATPDVAPRHLYNSVREGNVFNLYPEADAKIGFPEDKNSGIEVGLYDTWSREGIPDEADLHRQIYLKNKGATAIIHAMSPDIFTVSRLKKTIYPLLDDFAQIVGVSVPALVYDRTIEAAERIGWLMKGRNAVLIENNGALCCGPSKSDAAAVAMIMEKGCRTIIGSSLFGKVKPISPLESLLMRFVYLTRYSKKAAEK
ncbi:MAG: class II aldolase/adducin family protein [Firmicutes bacterium]|jgi:L-fuculose-phosphate aldolase|nr:class II aldolase/adducin family protein [Bacillota bacterium]